MCLSCACTIRSERISVAACRPHVGCHGGRVGHVVGSRRRVRRLNVRARLPTGRGAETGDSIRESAETRVQSRRTTDSLTESNWFLRFRTRHACGRHKHSHRTTVVIGTRRLSESRHDHLLMVGHFLCHGGTFCTTSHGRDGPSSSKRTRNTSAASVRVTSRRTARRHQCACGC